MSDTRNLVTLTCDIAKAEFESDERLVTGIVLQPDIIDAHQDIISAPVIKEAAHDFLARYNLSNQLGVQHKLFKQQIDLVESYIAPTELVLGGQEVKKGSWIMTVKVNDDALWGMVKGGALTGFSIGAIATVASQGESDAT